MAALLVALSVMAILLSVALPTWSQMIRREKEEELIFRGNQYARALSRYQRTRPGAAPTSLDELIKERLLRKKFKDPLSPEKDGEFQLLYLNQQGNGRTRRPRPARSSSKPSGGIRGVASKNTGQSLRILNGKNSLQRMGIRRDGTVITAGRRGAGGRGGRGTPPRGGGPQRGDGRGASMNLDERGNSTFTPQRGSPPPR